MCLVCSACGAFYRATQLRQKLDRQNACKTRLSKKAFLHKCFIVKVLRQYSVRAVPRMKGNGARGAIGYGDVEAVQSGTGSAQKFLEICVGSGQSGGCVEIACKMILKTYTEG